MRIAVLIPCRNEEAAVAGVVADFRTALPGADIFVYDNCSTDATRERAAAAGALVRSEMRVGKGNVVSRMFADVEADVYVMVDGDGTYDAAGAPDMVGKLWREGLDMVTGVRVSADRRAYRWGHRAGNRLMSVLVSRVFGVRCADVLSGYRVFSRRFVKSFARRVTGFEVETALTVHALELGMPVGEMETAYGARRPGSESKLRTVPDGARIVGAMLGLLLEGRPLAVMGMASAGCAVAAVAAGSGWLAMAAAGGVAVGLGLAAVARGRREARRLAYLRWPAPGSELAMPGQIPARVAGREARSATRRTRRLRRPR